MVEQILCCIVAIASVWYEMAKRMQLDFQCSINMYTSVEWIFQLFDLYFSVTLGIVWHLCIIVCMYGCPKFAVCHYWYDHTIILMMTNVIDVQVAYKTKPWLHIFN